MAFTPIDLPIQEMLQTDFIVDLAQIHNSNVLLLKDKLEDVINNFEIDTNTISIGTDNPINSIRTQDVVIQDGGLIFQTGVPNQIIARLSKNLSNESVFNVDRITTDLSISSDSLTTNDLTINNSSSFSGPTVFTDSLRFNASIIESKESIIVPVLKSGTNAIGTITLTSTSRKNIYVTVSANAAVGATQVWTGSAFNAISKIILNVDFDATNPPAANSTFTIHIVDVIEGSGSTSILSVAAGVNATSTPVSIAPGINQSSSNNIIMHYGLVAQGHKLAVNYSSANLLNRSLLKYGANATFNYIIDQDTNDRLIIQSMQGLEIY